MRLVPLRVSISTCPRQHASPTTTRSRRAVQVNIQIMRTFVQLRRLLATHEDLARKLSEMEGKYDTQFKVVFDAIRKLMQPPLVSGKPPIGFHKSDQK